MSQLLKQVQGEFLLYHYDINNADGIFQRCLNVSEAAMRYSWFTPVRS